MPLVASKKFDLDSHFGKKIMLYGLRISYLALGVLFALAAPALADDPLPDTCATQAPTRALADQTAVQIYPKFNPPATDPTLVIADETNPYPNTYIGLAACIEYTPVNPNTPFFVGQVTNAFLDNRGHYLGSNGQQLLDNMNKPLPIKMGHLFGAGIYLGYLLAPHEAVATQVLIETTLYDCATVEISSCGGTPKSFLTLFKTVPASVEPPLETPHHHSCAWPEGEIEDGKPKGTKSSQEPGDELFKLFAEGLMTVQDNVSGPTPTTSIGIDACLRLLPQIKDQVERLYYAQALAYVFDLNGRVLGLGSQTLAIGGQQLGSVESPTPKIIDGDRRVISDNGPIHDFGVTFTMPVLSHSDIDRQVLIAVTLNCVEGKTNCDTVPHTYYRIVDTCAPGLTNGGFDRSRCFDIAP